MAIKVVLDGRIFSECEMYGSNRSGMHRVAEDITTNLIKHEEIEISFANTGDTNEHNSLLREFVAARYPSHKSKTGADFSFLKSNIPKVRGLLRLLSRRITLLEIKKNDVFHSFYHPFPQKIQNDKIKKSVTLLDIIPLRIEGYGDMLVNNSKQLVENIKSNFAVSISRFSKEDLIDYDHRIDPERVFVVPLAASKTLFFQNKNNDAWKMVKIKYGLPDQYFLSVSSKDKRKNLPHLIKSFSKFVLQQRPKDIFLVLTGNSTYSYSILDELQIDNRAKAKIVITEGHIEDKDLSVVYSNALCFFFMSLYEGFGLPVLEAMQCGIPVVTSNATSLPEVTGDAGIMLPPTDQEALCEVMNQLYSNESLRTRYARAGLERAAQFSWQRTAKEYTAIFKRMATEF